MIYSSEFDTFWFRSSDNYSRRTYPCIQFLVTDGYDAEVPITLGGTPITIKSETDDNIYKPIKYKTATVNIISGDYNFNLYNSTVNNVGVVLKNNIYKHILDGDFWQHVIGEERDKESEAKLDYYFKGYVSPNLYDQAFNEAREEISIECTDALTSLKYINYLPDKKGIKSIWDIVLWCINQIIEPGIKELHKPWMKYIVGYVYGGNNTNWFDLIRTWENTYISDYAFFKTKSEGQTDTDVCMTCAEVLEEICKYYGCTCMQEGDYILFINYNLIKDKYSNISRYYKKFSLETEKFEQSSVSDAYYTVEIQGFGSGIRDGSGGMDNKLSLSDVYAKLTFKTDKTVIESVIPEPFDGATNITKSLDIDLNRSIGTATGLVTVSDIISGKETGTNKQMLMFVDYIYNDKEKDAYAAANAAAARYYKSPYVKCYNYGGANGRYLIETPTELNYTDTKTLRGGFLAKYWVQRLEEDKIWILDNKNGNFNFTVRTFDDLMRLNNISEISLNDYICLFNPSTNNIDNEGDFKYPFIEFETPEMDAFFGGKNAYIVISGTVKWHYKDDEAYPTPEGEYNPKKGQRETCGREQLYIPCKLEWDGNYWNGEKWVTTDTGFKLFYVDELKNNYYKASDIIAKEFSFPNTVDWRIGTKEKGICIPIPDGKIFNKPPKFTFYCPHNPKYNKSDANDYKPLRMFIKDFKIKSIQANPTYADNVETNTCWTNTINDAFINEMDPITLKVCPYDGKSPALNYIAYKDESDNFKYWDDSYLKDAVITNYIEHYSTPKRILELDFNTYPDQMVGWRLINKVCGYYIPFKDNAFNDTVYALDGYEWDVKNELVHARLVEM